MKWIVPFSYFSWTLPMFPSYCGYFTSTSLTCIRNMYSSSDDRSLMKFSLDQMCWSSINRNPMIGFHWYMQVWYYTLKGCFWFMLSQFAQIDISEGVKEVSPHTFIVLIRTRQWNFNFRNPVDEHFHVLSRVFVGIGFHNFPYRSSFPLPQ